MTSEKSVDNGWRAWNRGARFFSLFGFLNRRGGHESGSSRRGHWTNEASANEHISYPARLPTLGAIAYLSIRTYMA